MTQRRTLTGITTTGSPHLGNYVGAIKPAIAASLRADVESFYFLADYHALVKCFEPERIQRSTMEIAATWLALGLDPDKVYFYRQSDIREIPELTWFLTCVTGKGLLNRAHAYKAAVDKNSASAEDPDAGINAGLFMYPVLMAADIMIFNAHDVPVGRDQVQHIEMARDMAQRFNHLYGASYQQITGGDALPFVLPEAVVGEDTAVLPGLDGRKMSKSYDNTIPLWLSQKDLKKAILGILTNSLAPGEPKNADDSHLFTIYQAFASPEETAAMRQAYADGIAWGEVKQRLFERIDSELAPARAKYDELMADPARIEKILQDGEQKARIRSRKFIADLRAAVGLRNLNSGAARTDARKTDASNSTAAQFKSYREKDGKFYFKITAADGALLLQSLAFDTPKDSGTCIARLKAADPASWKVAGSRVHFDDDAAIGDLAANVDAESVRAAVSALIASEAKS